MIITQLIGGLGNQMFQYAAGLSLAMRHNTGLIADVSLYEHYNVHMLSIGNFNISGKIFCKDEMNNICFKRIKSLLHGKKYLNKYKEAGFEYDNNFKFLPDNTYLEGYWQSEKYFKHIRDIILNEFKISVLLGEKDIEICNEILGDTCASIHIRRGDYISNKYANQVHGTCSLDYYQNAIELLINAGVNKYYVFTDDHDWCRKNFKLKYEMVFVDHNSERNNYADLYLMSKCDHNIIANSTFSWWGAWLNENPEKIVFAPKNWFNDKAYNTKDLIPDSWIKI